MNNKKTRVIVLGAILIVLIVLVGIVSIWPKKNEGFEKTDYKKLDLENVSKLMVVAHPDDDVLWGGSELIKEDYLVVCITCGSDERRVKEFESVMGETGDAYAMLGYPDKTNGERDNWDTVMDDIIDDIKSIYNLKKWEKVVAHNPQGEYGHIHHKMTNKLVTDIVDHDDLFYFGKYYSKKDLEEKDIEPAFIDEELLKRKNEILNLYVSQDNTIHKTFGHMIGIENVMSYKDWMDIYEEK